jgi:hypothetical protein
MAREAMDRLAALFERFKSGEFIPLEQGKIAETDAIFELDRRLQALEIGEMPRGPFDAAFHPESVHVVTAEEYRDLTERERTNYAAQNAPYRGQP